MPESLRASWRVIAGRAFGREKPKRQAVYNNAGKAGMNKGTSQMKNFMQKLLGDKAGASAAEYALILAVFGGAVVIGVTALGSGFKTQMNNSKATIEKDYSVAP